MSLDRWLRVAAWTVATSIGLAALACVAIEAAAPDNPGSPLDPDATSGGQLLITVHSLLSAAFAVLGALVVSRQPRNAIGWLMILIGGSFVSIALSNQVYLRLALPDEDANPVEVAMLWVGNWAFLPAFVSAMVFLPLLFPTGRPPSPRWRFLAWTAVVGGAATFAGSAFKHGPFNGAEAFDNPLGIDHPLVGIAETLGFLILLPCAFAAIASLFLRYRRSTGLERQQLKWLAASSSLLPLALASALFIGEYSWPLLLLSLLVVAATIALAMLRYRLYDIDVVINRTLVYAALTATLATAYILMVLLLQLALRPLTERSDLAVAASTLVVAALFGPARRRIQQLVDRRFYRRRYDALRTASEFSGRLRQQVDLDELGADLISVVHETVQPAHASIWLRSTAVTIPGRVRTTP